MLTVAYIPCGSEEEAEKISEALIKEKLAACANIVKSKSVYKWEGKLNKTDEWIILAKTLPEKFENLKKMVREAHSYELPCIIAIPVTGFNDGYLNWVKEQL